MDGHKKLPINFQNFLKIYLAVMVENFDLALRAIIDSFLIYTINF